jgi:hypothetical protein
MYLFYYAANTVFQTAGGHCHGNWVWQVGWRPAKLAA